MSKKTWKLGEVCKGGVITTEVKRQSILIIGKEWDHSAGDRKSSNQSKAKEFTRLEIHAENPDMETAFNIYLNDLTTHYHAEQIMEWIKEKIS